MHADCTIVGVEITDQACAVNTHPFSGSTAFMLGNEVSHKITDKLPCVLAAKAHFWMGKQSQATLPVSITMHIVVGFCCRALDCQSSSSSFATALCTFLSMGTALPPLTSQLLHPSYCTILQYGQATRNAVGMVPSMMSLKLPSGLLQEVQRSAGSHMQSTCDISSGKLVLLFKLYEDESPTLEGC